MKLLCIKDSEDYCYTRRGKFQTPLQMRINKGEIYTVSEEVVGYKGELKWTLKEKPKNCRYKKEYFKILRDDDFVEDLEELDIEDLAMEDEPMYDFMY